MSTLNAAMRLTLDVLETFSADEYPLAAAPAMKINAANLSQTLNATSSPAATKMYAAELTGSQSLDLTALTDRTGAALDCSGLKLQALLVKNLSTTDAVVIADGASTPYSLNATADLTVPVGGTLGAYFADQLADVAAGAKDIDITAGVGEDYQVVMLLG